MEIQPLDDLIKYAADPKVLPFVAQKVLEKINDENTTIAEMSAIIEKDQSIASTVLKISNSAFYGLMQEVSSLKQAIMLLGLNAVKDMVISVTTKSQFKTFGITEKLLWDHAVGSAIASRLISINLERPVRDVSFLCGLMHDFGKVMMNNSNHEAFIKVMEKTYNEGLDSITAEEKVFGYNHTEVGSKIVAGWGFPQVYFEVLKEHHLDGRSLDTMEVTPLAKTVACINLSDNLCKVLGIGYREPYEGIELKELASTEFLEITGERIDELKNEVGSHYETERANFS